ncbi:hypothetical protein V2G26_014278 [Clonostachys chloroleuca]
MCLEAAICAALEPSSGAAPGGPGSSSETSSTLEPIIHHNQPVSLPRIPALPAMFHDAVFVLSPQAEFSPYHR